MPVEFYGMDSARIPPPVVFDLDVAENARLQDAFIIANGGRLSLFLVAFTLALQCIPPVIRVHRFPADDPFDWLLLFVLALLSVVACTATVAPRRWRRFLSKPQLGTTVAFDDAGLVIERGSEAGKHKKQRVAFAKIRSVQLTPGSLVIMGRLNAIILIPTRALADGGEQIMSFFEDRLVAKGRLYRATAARKTIVNTASS